MTRMRKDEEDKDGRIEEDEGLMRTMKTVTRTGGRG